MAIFLWLIQLVSPIGLVFGIFYLVENPDPVALIVGGVAALLGLIVGIVGWGDTVPPRWFWVKSRVDLAGSRVMTAISYALQFFFITLAIIGLLEVLGWLWCVWLSRNPQIGQ